MGVGRAGMEKNMEVPEGTKVEVAYGPAVRLPGIDPPTV